jgi:hypothetical protein
MDVLYVYDTPEEAAEEYPLYVATTVNVTADVPQFFVVLSANV